MQELASTIMIMRAALKEDMCCPLTKKDKEDHSDYLAQAFVDLLDKIGNTSISFLASTFLYNWVRLTTIASDLDEEYFQKLERNWDIIFDYIFKNEGSESPSC